MGQRPGCVDVGDLPPVPEPEPTQEPAEEPAGLPTGTPAPGTAASPLPPGEGRSTAPTASPSPAAAAPGERRTPRPGSSADAPTPTPTPTATRRTGEGGPPQPPPRTSLRSAGTGRCAPAGCSGSARSWAPSTGPSRRPVLCPGRCTSPRGPSPGTGWTDLLALTDDDRTGLLTVSAASQRVPDPRASDRMLVDGDADTGWVSGTDPTLTLDLGATRTVDTLRLVGDRRLAGAPPLKVEVRGAADGGRRVADVEDGGSVRLELAGRGPAADGELPDGRRHRRPRQLRPDPAGLEPAAAGPGRGGGAADRRHVARASRAGPARDRDLHLRAAREAGRSASWARPSGSTGSRSSCRARSPVSSCSTWHP